MSHSYGMTVTELRSMLQRVLQNENEEPYRKEAARGWIEKLDRMDEMWQQVSEKVDKITASGRMEEALLAQMQQGQLFDNLALIIRDSATVMFSEYLT